MFVKVSKPKEISGGDNKGSSFNLMQYLSKENEGKNPTEKSYFFNDKNDKISELKAVSIIDGNNQRLSEKETKFYMFTINPSKDENKHLVLLASQHKTDDYSKLTFNEKQRYNDYMKSYTNDVMQVYANVFQRVDDNGNPIKLSKEELNYVAKIEERRTYHYMDKYVNDNQKITTKIRAIQKDIEKETNPLSKRRLRDKVKRLEKGYHRDYNGYVNKEQGNIIKTDMPKGGNNMHVHVVVSRQTLSKWYKGEKIIDEKGKVIVNDPDKIEKARGLLLSPNANGKGNSNKHKVNGKSTKVGFHHEKFKEDCSHLFKDKFKYQAKEHELYKRKGVKTKDKSIVDDLVKKPQARVKSTLKNEVQGEAFKTEEKLLKAMLNPKQSIVNKLKQQVKEILLAKGL